jgi:gluconolactonase
MVLYSTVAIALPRAYAQHAFGGFDHKPDAIVDLRTRGGTEIVRGTWRYSDAKIVEVEHNSVGPDLKPSGPPNLTNDILPKAGAEHFDDSTWEVLDASTLDARRSTGRLCFNWYRINLTIPEKVGSFLTRGSTVVFEIVIDDYAEVWVDGKLPLVLGQAGGQLIKGWNAPNRIVIARDAQPGQSVQLAIFGMNGPISEPPGNFIWVRGATLDFYQPRALFPIVGEVLRLDPTLDAVVPPSAKIEKLAEGFQFTEGPVWNSRGGYLLFSDPNDNKIYRWAGDGELSVFRSHSGYTGADIGEYGQPGSNGLTLDREGRLTICEHGNRRVTRLERNGQITVLADRYEGRRLNSPNDLVYRSDGALYFTDPPFGLPKFHDDPRRELAYTGVYCLKDSKLALVSNDLTGPNGLAFSPDEKYLYVDDWDVRKKVVMRYEVAANGSLSNGSVFFDMTGAKGEEALDGLKVDRAGNLFVSGPGGVWVISPGAKHLGTIRPPELAANFNWGDADGRTLYMTARTGIYRIRLSPPTVVEAAALKR